MSRRSSRVKISEGGRARSNAVDPPFGLFLFALIAVMPLIRSSVLIDPNLLPDTLFLSLLIVTTAVWMFARRSAIADTIEIGQSSTMLAGAALLYLLITGLSIIWALNRADAVFDAVRVALMATTVLLLLILFSAESGKQRSVLAVRLTTLAFVISGLILSAIALCQYFGIAFTGMAQHGKLTATLANKGLMSSYLSLTLPFAVYGTYWLRMRWRLVAAAAGVLVLFTLVVAATRSSWVALVAGSVTVLPLLLISRYRERSLYRQSARPSRSGLYVLTAAIVIVVGGGAWMAGTKGGVNVVDRLNSILEHRDRSIRLRFEMWEKTLPLIEQHPMIGVGAGSWKLAVLGAGPMTYYENGSSLILFRRPHNDYIWVLSETGVVGLLAFLTILIVPLIRLTIVTQHRVETKTDRLIRDFQFALLFALISFCVDSVFSFPKERLTHLAALAVIVAAAVSLGGEAKSKRKLSRSGITTSLVLCLTLALGSLAVGYVRFKSEYYDKQMIAAYQSSQWQRVLKLFDKAYSPLYTIDETSMPLHWYRGVALYSEGKFDAARSAFERALIEHPYHPFLLNSLGSTYEQLEDHEKAIKFYREALRVNSRQDDARINLAAVYYNVGDYEAARRQIAEVNDTTSQRYKLVRDRILEKGLSTSGAGKKGLSEQ